MKILTKIIIGVAVDLTLSVGALAIQKIKNHVKKPRIDRVDPGPGNRLLLGDQYIKELKL